MSRPLTILMADDDPDDRFLAQEALAESGVPHDFRSVEDGEQLMAYLRRADAFADPASSPRPSLILLDLNMPRKDGREALQEIRADAVLRRVPILVLTTSQAEEDVQRCYDLGATSYVTKPATFERLVDFMKALGAYWAFVELPE